jgi:hypothetical protein
VALIIRGSVPDRGNGFFSSGQRLDQLWGPCSLSFDGYLGSFPGVKLSGPWRRSLASMECRGYEWVELHLHFPWALVAWAGTTLLIFITKWRRRFAYIGISGCNWLAAVLTRKLSYLLSTATQKLPGKLKGFPCRSFDCIWDLRFSCWCEVCCVEHTGRVFMVQNSAVPHVGGTQSDVRLHIA